MTSDFPRARVVIVPGLAVRSYARQSAQALRDQGYDVALLRAPTWRGAPADLGDYGDVLARQIDTRAQPVDVLVGLSVGSQAAVAAAAQTTLVNHLLLVSPTVDPANRTFLRLLRVWLFGDSYGDDPSVGSNLPDWMQAGPPRILIGFLSSLRVNIEELLPLVGCRVTIVHAEHDYLGSRRWARTLAAIHSSRLIFKSGAPHSWPIGDPAGFVQLIGEIVKDGE